MLNEEMLRRLDALSLRMRDRARGNAGGARRSRALGSSAEFSDFREYVPGDDIRRVDWNAYARFERLFIKLFMEEQEAVVHLIVDASASMAAKWSFAVQAAEMVAYLALSGGDRVRVVLLKDDEAQISVLYSGRGDFMKVAELLDATQPRGGTRLNEVMPRLSLRGNGLSVVFSDLFCEDGYERALKSLRYQKQQVVLVHALAQEEADPRFEGAMRLIDSETGEKVDLMAGGEAMRRYRAALEDFTRELERACHRNGIELIQIIAREGALMEMLRALMRSGTVH